MTQPRERIYGPFINDEAPLATSTLVLSRLRLPAVRRVVSRTKIDQVSTDDGLLLFDLLEAIPVSPLVNKPPGILIVDTHSYPDCIRSGHAPAKTDNPTGGMNGSLTPVLCAIRCPP
jgi:hypothetical protein